MRIFPESQLHTAATEHLYSCEVRALRSTLEKCEDGLVETGCSAYRRAGLLCLGGACGARAHLNGSSHACQALLLELEGG
jgi:hypothetical protein